MRALAIPRGGVYFPFASPSLLVKCPFVWLVSTFTLLRFFTSSPRSSPPDHEGLVHSFPLSLPASLQPSPAAIGKPLASTFSRRCHPPFLWPEPLALVQSSRSLVLGKLGSLALSRILPPDSQRLRDVGWLDVAGWVVSFRSLGERRLRCCESREWWGIPHVRCG